MEGENDWQHVLFESSGILEIFQVQMIVVAKLRRWEFSNAKCFVG